MGFLALGSAPDSCGLWLRHRFPPLTARMGSALSPPRFLEPGLPSPCLPPSVSPCPPVLPEGSVPGRRLPRGAPAPGAGQRLLRCRWESREHPASPWTAHPAPPGQRRSLRTLRSPHTHQRHSLPCEGQSPGWQVWLSPPPLPSPCSGGSGWPPRAAPAFGRLRSPQVAGRWGCGGPASPSPCQRDGGSSLLGEAGSVSHPRLGFSLKSMGWEGGETRGVTVENWVTQLRCWPQPHHLPHRWRQQLAHYSLRLSLAPCFFSC